MKIGDQQPASSEEVDEYNKFLALQKDTDTTPTESNVEIAKNNTDGTSTDYTVIGPFSIKYDGKDIKNIVVNATTYVPGTATNKNYIYIYNGSSASSTASDYKSDASEFKTTKIKKGDYFYLAVPTSILPSDGTYTVTINQNEFDYALSRVTITSGSLMQEYGVYDTYDSTEYKINASVSWTITANRNVSLIIYKTDALVYEEYTDNGITNVSTIAANGDLLKGDDFRFKLYAECSDGTEGWVYSVSEDDILNCAKGYSSSYDSATEYPASTTTDGTGNWIKNLKRGTYYIYETKTSNENYQLMNQGHHLKTNYDITTIPGGSDIGNSGAAYLGTANCTSTTKSEFGFRHNQYADGGMQIIKCDATTKKKLEGAEFKIYVELKDGTSGWMSGSADGTKTYGNSIGDAETYTTDSDGLINLLNLAYGTYYVYEVKAPDGYNLEDQPGYLDNDGGKAEGSGDFGANDGWAYIGCGTINQDTPESSNPLKVSQDNYEAPSIYISKYDEISGNELQGAKFKIYAKLTDGTSAWLTGTDDKSYTVTKAKEATSYLAYTEITNLRFGTYYIYETVAPTTDTNYVLADQEGYLQETDSSGNALPGASSLKSDGEEWAYKGSITLTTNDAGKTVEVKIDNRPEGSLQIGGGDGEGGDNDDEAAKVDGTTGEDLTTTEYGAYFKIYAVLETTGIDGISSGWVTGVANDGNLKTYGDLSNATQYEAGEVISRLRYGTYYIYETQAPSDNYDLKDQDNYHVTSDEDGVAKGYEDFADDEDWVYIGQVTINFELVSAGVDHGAEYVNGYTKSAAYKTESVKNYQKGKIQIEKVDQEYPDLKLEGAEFVIYAELDSEDIDNGWVKGNASDVKGYSSTYSEATVYTTDEDGLTEVIEKLNYGTYYIYEIKTPSGYDITKQDNYLTAPSGAVTPDTDDWVYTGSVEINKEELYTLYYESLQNGGEEYYIPPYPVEATNIKKVNELEGFVWVDEPDTKGNTGNNLYNEQNNTDSGSADTQDKLLSGIEVRLYLQDDDGNYYKAATTTTQSDGTYTFSFDPESENYCGIEVTYWQLVTAYVEFVYDNTTYVAVDPFVFGSFTDKNDYISINSKAQEAEMDSEELEDENLTGTTEEYPGLAVTYQDGTLGDKSVSALEAILSNTEAVAGIREDNENGTLDSDVATATLETTPLTGYYEKDSSDANHYKISNINLGLLEKLEPTYTVTEKLSYSYLTINGYTYTYYYKGSSTTDDENVEYIEDKDTLEAWVQKQTSSTGYANADRVSVYASDIESTNVGASNMKLYLVYKIDVKNTTDYTTNDLYYEQALYLTSLTDQYDTTRMELSKDNANNSQYVGSDQFGFWTTTDTIHNENYTDKDNYGTVEYAVNDVDGNYYTGITSSETRSTYVQFKVTNEALNTLISGSTNTIMEMNLNNASTAFASGFHEYLRTDNLWNQTEDAEDRWYTGNCYNNGREKDEYWYSSNSTENDTTNDSGDPYYVHKSENKDAYSGAYYILLELREDVDSARTVTAVVYEDESEKDDEGNETGVGNGIIDDTEKNRAYGVEVTLLSVSTTNEDDGTVTINTDSEGNIKTSTAVLYKLDDSGKIIKNEDGTYPEAVTTTNTSGEFTFEGVIPGYYYVQYTYGDGTQEIGYIDDESGEFVKVDDLTSNDYKSTIINTAENGAGETISNALELKDSEVLNYSDILEKYYNEDIKLEDGETISYEEALERYLNGELDGATAEQLEELQKALVMLEWYKYLNSTDYNTGVDDISEGSARYLMSGYTYTSQGVYDEDRNLIAEYTVETDENGNIDTKTGIKLTGTATEEDGTETTTFPLNVTATSPITSISIENDENKSVDVTYDETGLVATTCYHSTFDGFNFGIIKQDTDVDVEKVITKVTVELQQGTTVYSGNAATDSSKYATSLESVAVKNGITGSKYVRVELDEDQIYGSKLEVQYTVTITNNTAQSYDTDEWYIYGTTGTEDEESEVTVNEIVDLLDSKYVVTGLINEGKVEQILLDSNGDEITVEGGQTVAIDTESSYEVVREYYENYSETHTDTESTTDLYFSGFYSMTSGQSVQISYSVYSVVTSNDDTAYSNQVELTSLSLSGIKTLNSDFGWPWSGSGHTSDGTDIVLTPATGGDMSNTYWVVGAIALLVVAGGVVILKKKVLK